MSATESHRVRKRSLQACQNCRRKKTRCPGEKPACSSCTRLNQSCYYGAVVARPVLQEGALGDRIALIEEKLDLILNGNNSRERTTSQEEVFADLGGASEASICPSIDATDDLGPGLSTPSKLPQPETITKAIGLYFERCHRQPIWCFERADLDDYDILPEELAYSILALTSRFLPPPERLLHYSSSARRVIMLRIANSMVSVATVEALCLLSFCFFLDGELPMGQFHLGLALVLVQTALLDIAATYRKAEPSDERKKRLFWSLQILNYYYGRHAKLFTSVKEILCMLPRPSEHDSGSQDCFSIGLPPLPKDLTKGMASHEPGIWCFTVQLCWIWDQVRTYISDCANNRLLMPWLHNSSYAIINSELVQLEDHIPQCHRYDGAKLYACEATQVINDAAYWYPWIKVQLTYHTTHMVLNHPFLYIAAAAKNPSLNTASTFWKRSSELVLLHATWIARMFDIVEEKGLRLTDPFFAHAAAIAASVHLFYRCSSHSRLRIKSTTDLGKCRTVLKSFAAFSHACAWLNENLDRMVQIAVGPMDLQQGTDSPSSPSTIRLSNHLMWNILNFDCGLEARDASINSLYDPTLRPAAQSGRNSPTLEIPVSTPPEVTVDTSDGGQAARTGTTYPPTSIDVPVPYTWNPEVPLIPTETTPGNDVSWLWTDQMPGLQLDHLSDQGGSSSWWDFGNL